MTYDLWLYNRYRITFKRCIKFNIYSSIIKWSTYPIDFIRYIYYLRTVFLRFLFENYIALLSRFIFFNLLR